MLLLVLTHPGSPRQVWAIPSRAVLDLAEFINTNPTGDGAGSGIAISRSRVSAILRPELKIPNHIKYYVTLPTWTQ